MNEAEQAAFEAADHEAAKAAMPALQAMRKMTPAQLNERTFTFLISELGHMIEEESNWKHTALAEEVADLLSSAVSILEDASDASIRAGL